MMETISCPNCGAANSADSKFCQFCGTALPHQSPPSYAGPQTPPYVGPQPNGYSYAGSPYPVCAPKSRLAAGLLAIFLGHLGIHNFYLGYTHRALVQLLVSLLTFGIGAIAMWIWGLIEGIQILTGSINVDARGVPLGD